MSTALATSVQLPAHIAAVAKPNAYLDQFGDMQSADIKLNFIKICYPDSPQATKLGWGPTGQEPKLPAQTMFLSRSGQVVPIDTSFIPLFRSVKYIAWEGRPGAGKMLFATSDKNDERILRYVKDPQTGKFISGLEFLKDPRSQKTIAPPVVTYINIYIYLPICPWPCLLSFKRTSTPAGHQFSSDMFMATSNGSIPMHSLKFKFGPPKIVDSDGPKPYYHFTWRAAGLVEDPAVFAKAAELSKIAEAMNKVTSDEEYETGEDHDTEPARTTVTVQATQTPTLPTLQTPAPAINIPAAPVVMVQAPPLPQVQAAPVAAPATITPQTAPEAIQPTVPLW